MNREYHKWRSPRLGRDMELLVFGHAGAKVLVFPTRMGRFYEYEDMRMPAALAAKLDPGHLQLFCVDALDEEALCHRGASPAERIQRHILYEEYVVDEVLPFMNGRNPHECVIAHGCSLGAFRAANLAFRRPHLFRKLAAFSGRFNLAEAVGEFPDFFDGHYGDDVYFNTPLHFLPNLACEDTLGWVRRMDIVLAVGEHDPFLASNEALSRVLADKGVAHRLHVWNGRAHQGYDWRRMARLYL